MTQVPSEAPSGLLAFDSGIGGLSIVRELRRLLPDARIDYLADNAVFPYGELPDDVLVERVCGVIGTAIERLRPGLVLVACNTASTIALAALRERFAVPFVGCVPPIKWAAETSRTRHIGLLATAATVRRPYLRMLQEQYAPDCRLIAYGARGLADLAEAAFRGHAPDPDAIRRELDRMFGQLGGDRIDVVGLGCTHYGVLLPMLRDLSPAGIAWLDPAAAVARRAAAMAEETGTGSGGSGGGRTWFTAPPGDEAGLHDGLVAVGYDGIHRFDAAVARDRSPAPPYRPRLTV